MIYHAAATALAVLHLAFIIFVAIGALLVLRWRRVMYVQLPAAIWGALIELTQWDCPLTSWENLMMRRAGDAGYSDGFVAHYLFGVIYPHGLTRPVEIAIAVFVTVVNVAVYHHVFHGKGARPRGSSEAGRA